MNKAIGLITTNYANENFGKLAESIPTVPSSIIWVLEKNGLWTEKAEAYSCFPVRFTE